MTTITDDELRSLADDLRDESKVDYIYRKLVGLRDRVIADVYAQPIEVIERTHAGDYLDVIKERRAAADATTAAGVEGVNE